MIFCEYLKRFGRKKGTDLTACDTWSMQFY